MPVDSIGVLGSQNDNNVEFSDAPSCQQSAIAFEASFGILKKDETIGTSEHDLFVTSCLTQLLNFGEILQVTPTDLDRAYKQYEELFDLVQNIVTAERYNATSALKQAKSDMEEYRSGIIDHIHRLSEATAREQMLTSHNEPDEKLFTTIVASLQKQLLAATGTLPDSKRSSISSIGDNDTTEQEPSMDDSGIVVDVIDDGELSRDIKKIDALKRHIEHITKAREVYLFKQSQELEAIAKEKETCSSKIPLFSKELNDSISAHKYLSELSYASNMQLHKIVPEDTNDPRTYARGINRGLDKLNYFFESYSEALSNTRNGDPEFVKSLEILGKNIQAAKSSALAMRDILKSVA